MEDRASLDVRLQEFVGLEAEPARVARYGVNEAMIRNWVEALDDFNPVYVDAEVARSTGRQGVVAPPAMISTWVMRGYRGLREAERARLRGEAQDFAYSRLLELLDREGYTSVVATNVDQSYGREMQVGDVVTCSFMIDSVSGLKRTGLGDGYFITLQKRYVNQYGDHLGDEEFRILRFVPGSKEDGN